MHSKNNTYTNLFPVSINEESRVKALYDYDILDTFTENEYEFITMMASRICHTPVALITLLDKKRQWIKSSFGFNIKETPRELSFCNYTILDPENVNVVSDLRVDDRYKNNPLVTGEPHAVFYAGAPLVTPEGFVLGSLCVLDAKVSTLSHEQQETLKALAKQVIIVMELRKKNKSLQLSETELKKANKKLGEFAKFVSHDMKTPLANITMLSKGFQISHKDTLDEQSIGYISIIEKSALELLDFIDKMLKKSLETEDAAPEKSTNTLSVLNKTIEFLAPSEDIEINIKGNFANLPVDELSLQQVFQNLITNAIKYNDKPKASIKIIGDQDNEYHYFYISDNGSGIAKTNLKKIFSNKTLDKTDRYGNKGTGVGLSKVKSILESLGGHISVASKLKVGTDFKVCIPLKMAN